MEKQEFVSNFANAVVSNSDEHDVDNLLELYSRAVEKATKYYDNKPQKWLI